MAGWLQALFFMLLIGGFGVLMWMVVPIEQTLGSTFPNVLVVSGLGKDLIEPVSFDNISLGALTESEAIGLNGFYQFDFRFYHKTMDRFIPWEDRHKAIVWSCTLFCRPINATQRRDQAVLIHYSPDPKKHLWYLTELREDDANSPIIFARSKYRKQHTYRSPWLTVTPGGEVKPRDLPDVHLLSAWDMFRFDTPLKWGVTVTLVLLAGLWYMCRRDDD